MTENQANSENGNSAFSAEDEKVTEEHGLLKVSCHSCLQKLDVSSLVPFSLFACPACGAEIIVPKWFDSYLLEEHWGCGGMADVYRALDPTLDREVAIKILKTDTSSMEHFGEIFLNEGRIAANINHPAVVPIYSCGEFDQRPYLVMQFMEHGNLEQILRNRKELPVDLVLRWMIDIASGLNSAFKMGIIHHDIKPANILLDSDGNAKIGDFGLSNALYDIRSEKLANVTRFWGSPEYVSPEKIAEGHEDYHGDIYSLGITIYELLTGKCPFEKKHDSQEMLDERISRSFSPLSELRPEVGVELSSLVGAMLAFDYEGRPDYSQIIAGLKTILKARVAVSPKNRWQKIPLPVKIATVVFAVMLVVALGLLLLMPHEQKEKTPPVNHLLKAEAFFSEGKSREGNAAATLVFEDLTPGFERRNDAALLAALGAYLNLDEHAAETCAVLHKRLLAAGSSSGSPAEQIISYLEQTQVSDNFLLENMSGQPVEYRQLAALAMLLRKLYLKDPHENIAQSFESWEKVMKEAPQSWPGRIWIERLPLYRQSIFAGKTTSPLEPAFAPRQNNLGIETK
ncbi:MAG: serine/threonine-protein kinase [Victivallaceae bacterium]